MAIEPWVPHTTNEHADRAVITGALSVVYDAMERVQTLIRTSPHLPAQVRLEADESLGFALDAIDDAEYTVRPKPRKPLGTAVPDVRVSPGIDTPYRVFVEGAEAGEFYDRDEALDAADQYRAEIRQAQQNGGSAA